MNLDPEWIASGKLTELKVRFPTFEKHFDLPPSAIDFPELLGTELFSGDVGQ